MKSKKNTLTFGIVRPPQPEPPKVDATAATPPVAMASPLDVTQLG